MKIVSQKGLEYLKKSYNIKNISGYLKPYVIILCDEDMVKEFRDLLIDHEVSYTFDFTRFEIHQKELIKLFSDKLLEEGRYWYTQNKIFKCNEMNQQHLSNCVNYLEILLTLGKISEEGIKNYMLSLEESIIPELEERFEGEILDYVPFADYDKNLYKEFLKIKKKN